jgi:hypothetical protein
MGGLSEFHGWRSQREGTVSSDKTQKKKYETKGKYWGGIISVGVGRREGGSGGLSAVPNPTLQFATSSRH